MLSNMQLVCACSYLFLGSWQRGGLTSTAEGERRSNTQTPGRTGKIHLTCIMIVTDFSLLENAVRVAALPSRLRYNVVSSDDDHSVIMLLL